MSDIVTEDLHAIVASNNGWAAFSNKTVLVTGAGGFIGNYLVRTLLALNTLGLLDLPVRVIAMVRSLEKARERFAGLANSAELDLLHFDLTMGAVPELPRVDYIIHAASQASPRYYGVDPVGTMLPNIRGTASLKGSRSWLEGLPLCCSSEIYGNAAAAGESLAEDNPGLVDSMDPRSCYAEGKRAGETLCVAWYRQYGVPTYIVRPFHTYGPGLEPDDGRVFADFVYNAVRGQDILIRGDGKARRAYCYITDAVAAMFMVLLAGEPATAYNVGNPEGELSVAELAGLVANLRSDVNLRVSMQR